MTNPYSLKATKMNSAFDPGEIHAKKIKRSKHCVTATTASVKCLVWHGSRFKRINFNRTKLSALEVNIKPPSW